MLGNKRAAALARHITTHGTTRHVALVVSTRSVNRRDFGGDTALITELARDNSVAYDRATAEYLHTLTHPDGQPTEGPGCRGGDVPGGRPRWRRNGPASNPDSDGLVTPRCRGAMVGE